jgi:cell division protein FtsI/penicillin-binding protein 2
MALVASAIAGRGVRRLPTLLEGPPPAPAKRVTTRRIARTVEKLMIGVVQNGTGTAAAITGVKVAGKTGTAELKSTVGPTPQTNQQDQQAQKQNQPPETDAWFACYAPTRHPKIAVGVMFVKAGAGGSVAAPAAKLVLQAALGG